MEILISGASGFVGSHLSSFFRKKHTVIELSLRDQNWESKINEPDVFINLIGKAHDHQGVATEADYEFANVERTKEVFQSFKNSTAKILIHVSSIAAVEEYGSGNVIDEKSKCNPTSYYGKSKKEAEDFILNQDLQNNKRIIILRPCMIHGPGDKGNLMLFYKMISKGIPYPLAKYRNKRSFIGIDNFIYLVEKIICNKDLLPSGIYNICDDEAVSTQEILEEIGKVTNRKVINMPVPKFVINSVAKLGDYVPLPINTKRLKKLTLDLVVSNKKIKTALNIKSLPQTAKEGLRKTIKSFQDK